MKENKPENTLRKDLILHVISKHIKDLKGIDENILLLQVDSQTDEKSSWPHTLEVLSRASKNLTSENAPDYALLSGRLSAERLQNIIFPEGIPDLFHLINTNTNLGWYTTEILESYSKEDIDFLNKKIKHERDFNIPASGMGQLEGKYLVQDRVSGSIKETPQFAFMLIAMLFAKTKKAQKERNEFAIKIYNAISLFKISLPTPIMAGVRTPTRQFSSCTLIEAGDSLDMINSASSSIIKYVSQRAGIGLNIGMIRGLGSKIRGGEAFHTGLIPFIKHFQTAVKSCSQGGVRGGAATLFYPIWHLEFESLIVLKNNKGIEENRARHVDYGVQLNKLFYTRVMKGRDISLFSPDKVPGLYEAFFNDQEKFESLYLKYEADESIYRKTISAIDVFSTLAQERNNTGRIYIQNVDHTNEYGPFIPEVAPVKQSNLCMEITLPTKPMEKHAYDETGEIALCTLAGFNVGKIGSLDELEELSELIVEMLDFILDYQDYPLPAAKKATEYRRTLGVGVINWSYYLAKNKVRISDDSALKLTHETFEAIQYYLLKASNKLAKEKGKCPGFHETDYSKGILPVDNYKKDIDDLGDFELKLDWDNLRQDILEHGLRNSTLTALMPAETSSQISGSTNGVEPPLAGVSIKSSKDGNLPIAVPELSRLRPYYEFKWDIKDNKPYLRMMGVMQKFVDQAISTNTNYDPNNYTDNKTPIKLVLQDIFYAYKMGLKTLYYQNTRDRSGDDQEDQCEGGGCKL